MSVIDSVANEEVLLSGNWISLDILWGFEGMHNEDLMRSSNENTNQNKNDMAGRCFCLNNLFYNVVLTDVTTHQRL